jgi:hypothetical protein
MPKGTDPALHNVFRTEVAIPKADHSTWFEASDAEIVVDASIGQKYSTATLLPVKFLHGAFGSD